MCVCVWVEELILKCIRNRNLAKKILKRKKRKRRKKEKEKATAKELGTPDSNISYKEAKIMWYRYKHKQIDQ